MAEAVREGGTLLAAALATAFEVDPELNGFVCEVDGLVFVVLVVNGGTDDRSST